MPVSLSPFEALFGAAIVLDLVLGDPRWFPHPVRMMGWLCARLESVFRRIFTNKRLAGTITVLAVLVICTGLSFAGLWLAGLYSSRLAEVAAIFLLYTTIAARDLVRHSTAVFNALQQEGEAGLQAARQAVSMIVGRDTTELDRSGVIRAAVETVAENMVDGVTAPLFYAVLGAFIGSLTGISPICMASLGAIGYKAINTMDSIFGYKNEQYLAFGWAAARLDDAANFLPARLSGLLLVPAAFCLGLDGKNAFTTFLADRLNHASPNSGHSEAAVAGALGVQLGGTSRYFGQSVSKPTIGKQRRTSADTDILHANHLMLAGSALVVIVLLGIRQLALYITL